MKVWDLPIGMFFYTISYLVDKQKKEEAELKKMRRQH